MPAHAPTQFSAAAWQNSSGWTSHDQHSLDVPQQPVACSDSARPGGVVAATRLTNSSSIGSELDAGADAGLFF